jgi:hypothetical protein
MGSITPVVLAVATQTVTCAFPQLTVTAWPPVRRPLGSRSPVTTDSNFGVSAHWGGGIFPGLVYVEGAATRRSTTRGLIAPLIEAGKELNTRIAAIDVARDPYGGVARVRHSLVLWGSWPAGYRIRGALRAHASAPIQSTRLLTVAPSREERPCWRARVAVGEDESQPPR